MKNLVFYTILAIASAFAFSSCDHAANRPVSPVIHVGDYIPSEGGIVVGINPSNDTAFVAPARYNAGDSTWELNYYKVPSMTWPAARTYTDTSTYAGHTDWRMATRGDFDCSYQFFYAPGVTNNTWYRDDQYYLMKIGNCSAPVFYNAGNSESTMIREYSF